MVFTFQVANGTSQQELGALRMYQIKIICLIIFLTLLTFIAPAKAWDGKVVGVSDGDTITVMHNGRGERIRVYGIDAPENSQDFGKRAKQFASNQVFGEIVTIEPIDVDRYGRTVSIVVYGRGQNLSEELIKAGYAWVYRKYCTLRFCGEWQGLEHDARIEGVGLWSQSQPIPPWIFRKKRNRE